MAGRMRIGILLRRGERSRASRARPSRWLFSGWNCTPMTAPWVIALAKRAAPYSVVPATTEASAGSAANVCAK